MNTGFLTRGKCFAACVLLGMAARCLAQAPDADPPGRAARLSYAVGDVSFEPAGMTEWAAAVVNRPMTTGDKLWSDQNSRAEVEVGALTVRLGPTTGFSFLNLDDHVAQLQVTAGTLELSVHELNDGDSIEVDTPTLALTVLQPGSYRVEVNDTGNVTVVKVASGDAEASGRGQTFPVHAQQSATFTDTGGLTADVATLGAPDDFDAWCLQRDRRDEQAAQSEDQYVSNDVPGYEDLQDYGSWQTVPDYGSVWVPTAVGLGWAPYRFGRWLWVSPWGWTWVDSAPWGFAPFHYGRWAFLKGSWCWVPGPRRARPTYAPALVAWVGGAHFNLSASAGGIEPGIAWLPLGPREVFVPGYHGSDAYIRRINLSNTTIANGAAITYALAHRDDLSYANRAAPGALTAVPRSAFADAQSVASHAVRLNEGQLAGTTVNSLPPSVVPARASRLGAAPATRLPPAALTSRLVVARRTPPPAPVSFEHEREAIRANGGQPLAPTQLAPLQARAPVAAFRPANQLPPRASFAPVPTPAQSGNAVPYTPGAAPRVSELRTDRPLQAVERQREDRPPRAYNPGGVATPYQAPVERPSYPTPRSARPATEQRFTPPPRTEAPPPPAPPPPPRPREKSSQHEEHATGREQHPAAHERS